MICSPLPQILDFHSQLQTLHKDGLFISDYITKAYTLSHYLATIGELVIDKDLMMYALSGLSNNSCYIPFIISMNMMHERPKFILFHSQLVIYEHIINQQSCINKDKVFHNSITYMNQLNSSQKSHSNSSKQEPWNL